MIDTERLRLARDADYETGSHLCGRAADEIERLTLENGKIANTLGAENLRLRAALKDIRDEVPKCDIHFQGKVAIDIAAAALATSSNEQLATCPHGRPETEVCPYCCGYR